MHYERAPHCRRSRLVWRRLRCTGPRSATAALGSNCSGESGAKGLQESIGKSAGESHLP